MRKLRCRTTNTILYIIYYLFYLLLYTLYYLLHLYYIISIFPPEYRKWKGLFVACLSLNLWRLMYLNTWSPLGGTVWGDCGTFRKWRLAGGSTLLWMASEGLLSHLLSVSSLCFICPNDHDQPTSSTMDSISPSGTVSQNTSLSLAVLDSQTQHYLLQIINTILQTARSILSGIKTTRC